MIAARSVSVGCLDASAEAGMSIATVVIAVAEREKIPTTRELWHAATVRAIPILGVHR